MAAWNPRANELFLQAAEIDSGEARRAHLDSACGEENFEITAAEPYEAADAMEGDAPLLYQAAHVPTGRVEIGGCLGKVEQLVVR